MGHVRGKRDDWHGVVLHRRNGRRTSVTMTVGLNAGGLLLVAHDNGKWHDRALDSLPLRVDCLKML